MADAGASTCAASFIQGRAGRDDRHVHRRRSTCRCRGSHDLGDRRVEVTLRVAATARNSVLGAVVGAAVGLGLATVAKDQVWAVGLVVVVSFMVFGLASMDQVGRQAALVASVIVLIPSSTGLTTPEFAGVRLLETLIGIVVALVVNATVLPPRAFRGARRHLGESYQSLAAMYRLVVAAEATGARDAAGVLAARRAFRASIRSVDELWDEALAERPALDELSPHWRAATRRIWEQCAAMDDAVMHSTARGQLEGARDQLRALAEATAEALDVVATTMTTSDVEPVPRSRSSTTCAGAARTGPRPGGPHHRAVLRRRAPGVHLRQLDDRDRRAARRPRHRAREHGGSGSAGHPARGLRLPPTISRRSRTAPRR
jgi:hypothetical protein